MSDECGAVPVWTCEECAFAFAAYHTNADSSYTCPVCEAESLRHQLDDERRLGKYYVKARVYGAIAAEYQGALQKLAHTDAAKAALEWRSSDRNGVPFAAVEAIGNLLDAQRALEESRAEVGRLERERDGMREALETIRGGVVELADGLGPLRTQLNRINTTAIRYVEDAIRDALIKTEGPADGRDG